MRKQNSTALRGRVLAASLESDIVVDRIMSRPLITIGSDTPTFATLRLMLDENIHHLPLTEEGKIIGVISAADVLCSKDRIRFTCAVSLKTGMTRAP